jgi:hypothetical protein
VPATIDPPERDADEHGRQPQQLGNPLGGLDALTNAVAL